MTLEARDNAAKIVPATACAESPPKFVRPKKALRENRFQSSASQTAFIDTDIVAVLSGSQNGKQKSVETHSCSETRRFSSGSVHIPETSVSTITQDITDRTRQDRTKAFVNEDFLVKERLHKCPSAPCISRLEGKADCVNGAHGKRCKEPNYYQDRW